MPADRSGIPLWAKLLAAAVIVTIIARATLHYAGQLQPYFAALHFGPLLCGLLACILYRVLNSAGWVGVLRALDQTIPLVRGMRLWLLAESARWLPGSVWGFCSRVYQARRQGVSPTIASASLPLELLLTIGAWTLAAAGGLWFSGHHVEWSQLVSPRLILLAALAAIAGAAALGTCIFGYPESRLATKIRALLDELSALRHLSLRPGWLFLTAFYYTALCCVNGVAFYVVLRAVTDLPVDLVALIGINACGWLIGFLAIGAPGGIGVREATSAFLLSTMIPLPAAIAVSILWRLVLIVDEVLCLAVCLVPTVLSPRRETVSVPATT